MSDVSFKDAGFDSHILKALDALGFTEPTPVQARAFPLLMKGADLLAVAQTGTGKTAAFALPILQKICSEEKSKSKGQQEGHQKGIQNGKQKESANASLTSHAKTGKTQATTPFALILAPTRELATQIEKNIRDYARFLTVDTALLVGGASLSTQLKALAVNPAIVIATPGRFIDHLRNARIDLSALQALVLDEADRMLDMGFIDDIMKILAECPRNCQRMLFSATVTDSVKALAQDLLHRAQLIEIAPNRDVQAIEQTVYRVQKADKHRLLRDLIVDGAWAQVLVFTRLKTTAQALASELKKDGFKVESLHGNKTQAARFKALARFKDKSLQILVATDVAARGLDIESLPYVVNYDLPTHAEDYVHRIGRTGRAGKTGIAVSFMEPAEAFRLKAIEELIGKTLPVKNLAPDVSDKPQKREKTEDRAKTSERPKKEKARGAGTGFQKKEKEGKTRSRANVKGSPATARSLSKKKTEKPRQKDAPIDFDYVLPDF